MAGNYVEKAVSLMIAQYETYLEAELAIVEGEASLSAGDLTVPTAYIDYFAPEDVRSPLISIFEDDRVLVDQPSGRVYSVPVTVALGWLGDADLSANAAFVRRYMTAMIRTVTGNANALASSGVISANFAGMVAREQSGPVSDTRHTVAIGWGVLVDEKEC